MNNATPIETGATQTEPFVPQEIAFRKWSRGAPGAWKRKVIKTEKAFDAFIERLQSGDYDIECRDAL
jgi:hypothetical protein